MRPTGKDRKIMKRDLGGLYAVGVFRLNKVGGFVFEGDGEKPVGCRILSWEIAILNFQRIVFYT